MLHWMKPWRERSSIARVVQDFAASLIEEFWRAFVVNAALTAHVDLIRARNAHHAAEAIFKAGALALHAATRQTGDPMTIPSTKGVLA
jgi:imidazoleglycerol-phosphate dehydratase